MAKKKQPDFQKTKLRVGKSLPKGKNVTNTAFKSKKIITRDQKFKSSPEDTSLADLLSLTHQKTISRKLDATKRIGKFIDENISTLPSYFAAILNSLGKALLEDSALVREAAIDVISLCVRSLSTSQLSCFASILASYMDCMMTHVLLPIRKDSLDLLNNVMKSHPSLICNSTKLLGNLLNMISSNVTSKKKDESPKQNKRKLVDNINRNVVSVEWRNQVLELIALFLRNLVYSSKKSKKSNDDDQKVYWDGKHPLYVPLYAGSGLIPAKLEFYSTEQTKSQSTITKELRLYLNALVSVSSDIVTEELSSLKTCEDGNILHPDHVHHLRTVTDVLCYLGYWFKLRFDLDDNEDPELFRLMNFSICNNLMKGFPYSQQEFVVSKKHTPKSREIDCLHLNLGICYLYSIFVLGTSYNKPVLGRKCLIYLCSLLGREINLPDLESQSLVLKVCQSFVDCVSSPKGERIAEYPTAIPEIIKALFRILETCKHKDSADELYSFFIRLSLDYEYRFLLDCEGMHLWFKHLFVELKHMKINNEANKKILKCIDQITTREYPVFIAALNEMDPSEILDYLKLEDEDIQFTAMNLITHMTHLPPEFLQDVADVILCDHSLNIKTIVKFIRLLYRRFSDSQVCHEEVFEFVKFLLNVGFDIVAVEKAVEGCEEMDMMEDGRTLNDIEMTDQDMDENDHSRKDYSVRKPLSEEIELKYLLLDVQQICVYKILPSQQWERHSEIFQVCLECLLLFPARDLMMKWTRSFLSELLSTKITLPVHSALALMELATQIYIYDNYMMRNKCAELIIHELTISSLFYISILTNKLPSEKLKKYYIRELQNSMHLNRKKTIQTLELLTNKIYEQGLDEVKCLYILRIIKFCISMEYVDANDIMNFIPVIQATESYCPENTQQQAVLYDIYVYLQNNSHQ